MPLPAPNLDDRRFQDLVDDAKRLVQRHCPEWTDHNVSDPGVTLIETFAYMTDQLLYRLNRVPDRLYLKFLDLIGLRMLPPSPASVPVTFWLSAPVVTPLTIPAATRLGTPRTQSQDAVEFSTTEDLALPPRKLAAVRTTAVSDTDADPDAGTSDRTQQLAAGTTFPMFGDPPATDDALLIGLEGPAPRCAIRIDFDGQVEGIGVNPERPPLAWEAWSGLEWEACDVTLDETGGFNRPGAVIVHLPPGHDVSVIDGERPAGCGPGSPGLTRASRPTPARPACGGSARVRSAAPSPPCMPSWWNWRSSASPRACPARTCRWPGLRSWPVPPAQSWRSVPKRGGRNGRKWKTSRTADPMIRISCSTPAAAWSSSVPRSESPAARYVSTAPCPRPAALSGSAGTQSAAAARGTLPSARSAR